MFYVLFCFELLVTTGDKSTKEGEGHKVTRHLKRLTVQVIPIQAHQIVNAAPPTLG